MRCDKCGRSPLALIEQGQRGDENQVGDWPFDWCPFCVEREMHNPYEDRAVWKADIGRMKDDS